jgi:hypothetical protein
MNDGEVRARLQRYALAFLPAALRDLTRPGLPILVLMVSFCALIAEPFGFPLGDTLVSVRVHDTAGQPGPPASFVVRVTP